MRCRGREQCGAWLRRSWASATSCSTETAVDRGLCDSIHERFGNFKWLCHACRLLLLAQLAGSQDAMTRPLRSISITETSSLLQVAPSLDRPSVLSASCFALEPFPLHGGGRFPQFNIGAKPRWRCLYAGRRMANKQVSAMLIPGQHLLPVSTSSPYFDT